jgi:hypothetical protein
MRAKGWEPTTSASSKGEESAWHSLCVSCGRRCLRTFTSLFLPHRISFFLALDVHVPPSLRTLSSPPTRVRRDFECYKSVRPQQLLCVRVRIILFHQRRAVTAADGVEKLLPPTSEHEKTSSKVSKELLSDSPLTCSLHLLLLRVYVSFSSLTQTSTLIIHKRGIPRISECVSSV